jgi:hypothetical protein
VITGFAYFDVFVQRLTLRLNVSIHRSKGFKEQSITIFGASVIVRIALLSACCSTSASGRVPLKEREGWNVLLYAAVAAIIEQLLPMAQQAEGLVHTGLVGRLGLVWDFR